MKKQVDTIIFDFDGVLVNTGPDIANAANYALRMNHLQELPADIIIGYIGGGAELLMRRCLKDQADSLLPKALPEFVEYYNENCCVDSHLYEDVLPVLKYFNNAGKTFAIATQKNEETAHKMVQQLGISSYFHCIVGPESITHRKPHPESVLRILDVTATGSERAVFVGDMPTDIQAGKAAGVFTCGVLYGYGAEEAMFAAEPDLLIGNLSQLTDWLE